MLLDFSDIVKLIAGNVNLPISKSLSNRALILSAISQNKISILEISDANDSVVLEKCLKSSDDVINVEDAGTVMRFLTAYFAFQNQSLQIQGTDRMHERPIGVLVEALNSIGAFVSYSGKEGFPPLQIEFCDKDALKNEVSISAETSSQFISALMLIAPSLPQGLTINLTGKVASRPYIEMTNNLLQQTGVKSTITENKISIPFHEFEPQALELESDWSGASYFYAIAALIPGSTIQLDNLNSNSFQGDSVLVVWFERYFGISSYFNKNGVSLSAISNFLFPKELELDFSNYPDLAQTIVVLCACLGIKLKATGLESLLIKETNRINALSTELKKLGIATYTTSNSIEIDEKIQFSATPVEINTYQDHRMAMAFSMVSFIRPIELDNEKVVTKSFPKFFTELKNIISS
ncbi:3-phosphoshikimate 1-carboxyvinyltransferase [Salibacteraceae bacterium]|nr:3-phosphoshikimate 1-carboxyvinyltransferase [Crocinitomicaceae bacterium]MDA9968064.1 3-phosphoshikimate 1-carboxyvinyltransferase [Salibacteraceae bacterium]|tara:strand:- start:103200 stop:104423 length:1224 start_codon:yes stop_codon:yes gene_type:complete